MIRVEKRSSKVYEPLSLIMETEHDFWVIHKALELSLGCTFELLPYMQPPITKDMVKCVLEALDDAWTG